jgi:DedD protein
MAFFKFRFPGQAASSPASAEAVAPGSGESIELVRRRARHRLIGAVVLVLLAVVGFPLMFDTQPRPVAVDTPIVIPDRQTTASLSASQAQPVEATPAKPLLPESKPLPAQEGLDAKEEVVPVDKPIPAEEGKPLVAQPEVKPAPAKVDKSETVAKPKDDGNKARALLEGKPPAAVGERHVVQVGAFSDAAKVREVRRKLEQAGLSTFTQVVDGKDGKTTTRVRVGPFGSREEAETAAARIRKLDFSPAVLRI